MHTSTYSLLFKHLKTETDKTINLSFYTSENWKRHAPTYRRNEIMPVGLVHVKVRTQKYGTEEPARYNIIHKLPKSGIQKFSENVGTTLKFYGQEVLHKESSVLRAKNIRSHRKNLVATVNWCPGLVHPFF
jgi:hypothetical protein